MGVGLGRVVLGRRPLRDLRPLRLVPLHVRRVLRRLAVFRPLGVQFLDAQTGREEVVVAVGREELAEQRLGLRPDGDHAGLPTVAILVLWGFVEPDLPARVDVAPADQTRLTWT